MGLQGGSLSVADLSGDRSEGHSVGSALARAGVGCLLRGASGDAGEWLVFLQPTNAVELPRDLNDSFCRLSLAKPRRNLR